MLRECILDPGVESVLVIGRRKLGTLPAKVREILREDVGDLAPIADELRGYDGCCFCLGVSSAGMKEADYRRVTYDLTLKAARTLAEASPNLIFIYVSGAGTDSTEHGRSMWARVKGETENVLLSLPFKAAYMLRPGLIQPRHGIKSKTPIYRVIYILGSPLIALLKVMTPGLVTTTDRVGRAMIKLIAGSSAERVLENKEINRLAIS